MGKYEIGKKSKRECLVTKDLLASSVGSGSVDVLATPIVAAIMEGAASDLAQTFLEDYYTTVGTKIIVEHLNATAEGVNVWAEAELTNVDGRKYTFLLRAFDNNGLIATGEHIRVSVKKDSFLKKAIERKNY